EHLRWWSNELNCFKQEKRYKEEEKFLDENKLSDLRIDGYDLLTLNFQLNQLLMLINNPMFFPHYAYAKLFQKQITK
ncbi:hypothetical protein V7198_16650, partial [Bacillus pumilus]